MNLVPGNKYFVVIDDCCVCGSFTDVFVAFGGDYNDEFIFEHATLTRAYPHAVTFYNEEESKEAEE